MNRRLLTALTLAIAASFPLTGWAAPFGNSQGTVEFPQGISSFADAVASYNQGSNPGFPFPPYTNPVNALGAPNYASNPNCTDPNTCTFVSLGRFGSLTVRFTDNLLTGSNNTDQDLFIFEVGPAVEPMSVEISNDGVTFFSVGSVGGSTSGVDIDAFGFTAADRFSFVRVTDLGLFGLSDTAGADIDAIGAISSVPAAVPEPTSLTILALGMAGFGVLRRRRNAGRHTLTTISP